MSPVKSLTSMTLKRESQNLFHGAPKSKTQSTLESRVEKNLTASKSTNKQRYATTKKLDTITII